MISYDCNFCQRNNTDDKDESIKQTDGHEPDYFNYGYAEPGEGLFKKRKLVRRATILSLAIMMILSGVALGIGFGLRPTTEELNENFRHVLVIGGSATETEVIDLADSNMKCTSSYGKLEAERQWPVGGLIRNTPILCGGQDLNKKVNDSCILFGQNQTSSIKMNEKRFRSASVILNETTLWIMGGSTETYNDLLISTEFINLDLDTSINGPSLPMELDSSCAIKYNASHIYLTGGYYSGDQQRQDKVWIFNMYDINNATSSWTEGPKMKEARAVHGCTVLHQNQKSLIVVAGGWNEAGAVLSMEILDPLKSEWIKGPDLPFMLCDINQAMVASPDGMGIILIGGNSGSGSNGKTIFESRIDGSNFLPWQIIDQELDIGRMGHAVIPIPKSITNCMQNYSWMEP